MCDEAKLFDEQPEDRPQIEEVVSEFDGIRLRSGFRIEEVDPGVVNVNIFGPVFEFDDDGDDLDLEDQE